MADQPPSFARMDRLLRQEVSLAVAQNRS